MSGFYKVLDRNLCSMHGGRYQWVLGEWAPTIPEIIPCESGYHVCQESDLVYWLGPVIAECEVGRTIRSTEVFPKTVTDRCRIVRILTTWTDRTMRLFACDCAERVLPLFESVCPSDDRPRKAIQAARSYTRADKLRTAWSAAWKATVPVDPLEDPATYSAKCAAANAAGAARLVTNPYDSSYFVALGACTKARAAHRDSERYLEAQWQTQRLVQYLRGEAQ